MKKLIAICLCLSLLAGCVPVPLGSPEGSAVEADPALTATPAATVPAGTAGPKATPEPVRTASPTPVPTATPTPRPTWTPTPKPTATPKPKQTYAGTYFRFDVPGGWLRADIPDGVYFYPEQSDTRHAYLLYQETANEMRLTESSMDIALLFSSQETITAMVAGALTDSGMTNFKLSPVAIEKTKLNGSTCYRGASDIVIEGESHDFVGRIFLRKDRMVLLIWVGDQAKYADGLNTVYDSFTALR